VILVKSEDDTSAEASIADLVTSNWDNWATVGIHPNLELFEGNTGIKVLANDTENIEGVTGMVFGDSFFYVSRNKLILLTGIVQIQNFSKEPEMN
jgi:hypothetical protein